MQYNEISEGSRYINPEDITVERGYSIEVFAEGLDAPNCILFTDNGEMLITNSGYTSGSPSVMILRNGVFETIADQFNFPLLGITDYNGLIYVSHKGLISTLTFDGVRNDIIMGLPSYGDYSNCRVDFDYEGRMYFGLGTATNSGVVGTDNLWVPQHPYFHDSPGAPILLNGQNFLTPNILAANGREWVSTGAYSQFGEPTYQYEIMRGVTKASGSIVRARADGSNLELVAWGLRCPTYLEFYGDILYVSNNGYDIRGSRPIANAPDELLIINEGQWYGFPDYAGSEPVNLPRFTPDGGIQPEFLLASHPGIPPRPFALFPPDSFISGFGINRNEEFSNVGDIYVTEFGSIQLSTIGGINQRFPLSGYKVSKVDPFTGAVSTFAINKSGFPSYVTFEGGLGRPTDVAFGPDGAMYVIDMGTSLRENPNMIVPNTGVIWRITRNV